MTNLEELQTIYDSRQSFYGKAHVVTEKNRKLLFSYCYHIATYYPEQGKLVVKERYSNTTARHIREFARQNGIELKKVTGGTFYRN